MMNDRYEYLQKYPQNWIQVHDLNGLLIPYYLSVTDPPYNDTSAQRLLEAMRQHWDVPVLIIINPNNGPGVAPQSKYSQLITLFQAAGAKVLGYVSTGYAIRPDRDVRQDIDRWLHFYQSPGVDGIFLDEMPWDTGTGNASVYRYRNYTRYCHYAGLMTVANAGSNQQPKWFEMSSADVIVVHEDSVFPGEEYMAGNYVGGHADYTHQRRAGLIYGQGTLNTTQLAMMRKYVEYIYVTDDTLTNPWDTLPTYLEDLFEELSGVNLPPTGGGPAGDTAYRIGFSFVGGVLAANQLLGLHKFPKAVSFVSNFVGSSAGATANATGSTVVSISRALAASPNSFSQIGTLTFAAGTTTPTFAGSAVSCAAGDVLRLTGPATADATLANFYCTLVGA